LSDIIESRAPSTIWGYDVGEDCNLLWISSQAASCCFQGKYVTHNNPYESVTLFIFEVSILGALLLHMSTYVDGAVCNQLDHNCVQKTPRK